MAADNIDAYVNQVEFLHMMRGGDTTTRQLSVRIMFFVVSPLTHPLDRHYGCRQHRCIH